MLLYLLLYMAEQVWLEKQVKGSWEAHTGKLADHQKIVSLLGATLLEQSESLQCKFSAESLAVPLTPNSLAVQAASEVNPVFGPIRK